MNQLHLNCLNIVPVEVPIVAADAIEIAHDYWFGQSVDEFKLESSRGTCYDFLKSRGVFVQPIEKEHFAVKAIMGVMHENYSEDDYWLGLFCFAQYLRATFNPDDDVLFSRRVTPIVETFLNSIGNETEGNAPRSLAREENKELN